MDQPFSPELMPHPSEATPAQILSQLPDHFLATPTPSNYVALGVIYALMGMLDDLGNDSSVIDRTLTGVFTLLNDKAVALGLQAFEPPTPLTHPAQTHMAAFIDAFLSNKQPYEIPHLASMLKEASSEETQKS